MSATPKNTFVPGLFNPSLATPVTTNGYLPFFSEFLHGGGRFDSLVKNCPLEYKSNNAPQVRDVLGTAIISMRIDTWKAAHHGKSCKTWSDACFI